MAAKPTESAKETAAADKAAAAAEKGANEVAEKPAGSSFSAFIPLIAAIVIAPTLSWAVGQFVLMPQLKKQLAAADGSHAAASPEGSAPAAAKGGHGKKGEMADGTSYTFENMVVNLAGTMGTRYLKTTFLVIGTDGNLSMVFESSKPKLVDVTINVLSSLSLSDLEEAGAKNLIREKLIGAYNQALGKKVVEQVYFSDFVVQ